MKKLIAAVSLSLVLSCASAPLGQNSLPVEVVQGDQLKLWGVEANLGSDTLDIDAQVNRMALPVGQLREHVHVEILDASGQIISEHDAHLYPVVALRSRGQAKLDLRLPSGSLPQGGKIRMRVVNGIPHD
jgi:hypothetical protein